MSLPGRTIQANGINLNVYTEGEGQAVMLLHGFPDSNALWRKMISNLVAAGYRVVAPDQRGFGDSEAPPVKGDYDVEMIALDALAILDALNIEKAHLVGHDWGAMIGWWLAGKYSQRFESYTAISVGHPKAYATAGFEQKRRAWYILFFQLRGIAEKAFKAMDWGVFRRAVKHHPEMERWIADLSRPGRLTAGINWYRANLSKLWKVRFPRITIPVLGIWSSGDIALVEDQMVRSRRYVDATWRYERFDGVSHWIPLDVPDELSGVLLDFWDSL